MFMLLGTEYKFDKDNERVSQTDEWTDKQKNYHCTRYACINH